MDLPLISKRTNTHPSLTGFLMYFKSRSRRYSTSGRVRAYFPKAVKHEEYKENYQSKAPSRTSTKEEVLNTLKECEVSGCGGADYPIYKKLEAVMTSKNEKILIINAVECDIGLVHDDYIMANFFGEVEAAARILKDTFGFSRVMLGTMKNYSFTSDIIEIVKVEPGYPAGAEKILINSLLGIEIERNTPPTSQGILVQNVQTMYMAYKALTENEHYTGKYITLANLVTRTAKSVYVPFGTSIKAVAEENLGEQGTLTLLTGGGAMSGHIAKDDEVTAKTTALIAYGNEPYNQRTSECMSCNACNRACPMGINVRKVTDLILCEHLKEASAFSPQNCIGCNSCTYVCFLNRDNSRVIAEFNEQHK